MMIRKFPFRYRQLKRSMNAFFDAFLEEAKEKSRVDEGEIIIFFKFNKYFVQKLISSSLAPTFCLNMERLDGGGDLIPFLSSKSLVSIDINSLSDFEVIFFSKLTLAFEDWIVKEYVKRTREEG